jgi:DNA polymerase-3 subunit beta
MKFRASKDKLIEGLQQVQNIISNRTTMPILQNVLVEAAEDGLKLTTTDLDIAITCHVEATVQSRGVTTLPTKRLFTIVREMPAPEIEFEVDSKNHASIRAGGAFFKILGLPADEFPPVTQLEAATAITIQQGRFKEMLRRTCYAMSVDEARYVLTGLLVKFEQDKITMVATDGRRLALADDDVELTAAQVRSVVLPGKTVTELMRLLADEGETKLQFTDTRVAVQVGPTTILSKLVDGSYPNYEQVIPAETKERITIERETLSGALRRVSLLTSDKSQSVRFSFGRDKVDINANSPELGEAHESLAVKYRGREFNIAFNPTYLLDPLKVLTSDDVHFDFVDELSPGIIRTNASNFLYVIMPMRLA